MGGNFFWNILFLTCLHTYRSPSPFPSRSTFPASLRSCSTFTLGIYWVFPTFHLPLTWDLPDGDLDLLPLGLKPAAPPSFLRSCPTSLQGASYLLSTSHPLEAHLVGTWFCSLGVEDYFISCPTSQLGSSAGWQRYVIASAFTPMSESWADSSARVELVCRWSLFSPRALSMASCEKAPFRNKMSDEMTSPLSESSYATKCHHKNSHNLLPFLLIGVVRLMIRTVTKFCSPLLIISPDI